MRRKLAQFSLPRAISPNKATKAMQKDKKENIHECNMIRIRHKTKERNIFNQSQVRVGPWQITDTVLSDRKNLFCMSPQQAFHIATIVSGSRSQLSRFEEGLALMRAAPEMYQVLETVLVSIRSSDPAVSNVLASVTSEIEAALVRASSPFSEG